MTTRRDLPHVPTVTVAGRRVALGRANPRDPDGAIATIVVEEAGTAALADLTEHDLVALRNWLIDYIARLHEIE